MGQGRGGTIFDFLANVPEGQDYNCVGRFVFRDRLQWIRIEKIQCSESECHCTSGDHCASSKDRDRDYDRDVDQHWNVNNDRYVEDGDSHYDWDVERRNANDERHAEDRDGEHDS